MKEQIVTVFGGTGFLGNRVVKQLLEAGARVRVAARHPRAADFSEWRSQVVPVQVDVRDENAVTEAVSRATAVVNAVSLYVEKGDLGFNAIHVQGAERIARCAKRADVQRMVHVSGIGVNLDSPSPFVHARALGEKAVREVFADATIIRPSVMFARDGGFLKSVEMAIRLPVVPLFGRGETRLQPVCVDDVAAAIIRLSLADDCPSGVFELGGAKVYTYREAVQTLLAHTGRKRWLLPVPFPAWRVLVAGLKILPNPPLTRDQLILMQHDNIAGDDARTFSDLNIQPKSLEQCLT
ncbi:MAG: complex I NDUFA9 subunit family protein [Cellvibrionaceae bacterium]